MASLLLESLGLNRNLALESGKGEHKQKSAKR